MTGFGYPYLLFLLALAPVLALVFYMGGKRRAIKRDVFADRGRHASLGLGLRDRRAVISYMLIVASVALTAVSLARPLGPPAQGDEKSAGMDVILALDISDSMGVGDGNPDRLTAAKEFIKKMVRAAPNNRYGLTLFSGDAVVTCPLTLDHDTLLTFLDDATPARADLPGTAIGEALLTAANRFKPGELPRAVVVVSDGENTYGADPVSSAGTAREKGLKVYTVGVGTSGGGKIPYGVDFFGNVRYKQDKQGQVVVSRLDEGALKRVAQAGGGAYYSSTEAGAVALLAKDITVKSEKKVKDRFRDAKEYGPWVLAAAFGLLAVAVAL